MTFVIVKDFFNIYFRETCRKDIENKEDIDTKKEL